MWNVTKTVDERRQSRDYETAAQALGDATGEPSEEITTPEGRLISFEELQYLAQQRRPH